MQSAGALVSFLAIFAFSGCAAFRVDRRLHDIPIFVRIFVVVIIFVTMSGPLAFLAQFIVYGHL